MSIEDNKKYKLVFTKKDACGFQQGHVYAMTFTQDKKTKAWTGIASYDHTKECSVNLYYPLASSLSIDRYFTNYEEESWI
jgi:hypothetical protein